MLSYISYKERHEVVLQYIMSFAPLEHNYELSPNAFYDVFVFLRCQDRAFIGPYVAQSTSIVFK